MINKKLYYGLTILFFFSIISLVSVNAEIQTLGTFKVNDNIILKQTCSNCTYVNVSSVSFPNGNYALLGEHNMTKNGITYSLNFLNTSDIGKYIYCGYGDVNGIKTNFCADFDVTYSGAKVSLSNTVLVFAFLIVTIVCLVLGFSFKTNYWLIKTFFYFCAVLTGILTVNTARIIASESTALAKMGDMGLLITIVLFSLFFIIMFVFVFIEIIKALKKKGEIRWNY